MEKQKVLYAFNDDLHWEKILKDVDHIYARKDLVDKIAIIAFGTAILSILRNTSLEEIKTKITNYAAGGVDFYVCGNTMKKYGITKDQLIPVIQVAEEGTFIKILEMKEDGYFLFTLA